MARLCGAIDGALDEDELLAEIPEVAEPVYSHLADNTIVQVDASRNLLEQVGDQLLGARRASLPVRLPGAGCREEASGERVVIREP
mgnify:CR=1 FL=1